MVRDVGHNHGNFFDEFSVAGGEVVIDNDVMTLSGQLPHSMTTYVTTSSGDQHLHARIPFVCENAFSCV
jgi:hypothetical protein